MAKVKTAVSLSEEVLSNADKLAESLSTSRSQIFEMALSEFISRHQNQQMLQQLDIVYSEDSTEEVGLIQQMKPIHQSIVEEW
jgi:metal-responsive CopG/Arc/MetJ family transcriptional regulator